MNRIISRSAWAALAVMLWALPAVSGRAPSSSTPRRVARGPAQPARVERDARAQVFNQARRVDVNNINMFVTNYGTFANDIENQGNSGLFFPKGTIKTAVYQSGIWIGGKVGGQPRVAIAEYSQEFGPGAMVGTSADDPSRPEYVVYKVARYTGNPEDTAHVERSAADLQRDRTLDPIVHHSWSEYVNGAAPYGAPVRTYSLPDPNSPGNFVSVVGPDVSGDQMLWAVYNDADPGVHTNRGGGSLPLGVEVQQKTFAFDRQGALGNTVFLEYKLLNKGGNDIDSCYIMFWSDPDLGGASDDLVGCDTSLSMGYVYNATNVDQVYGDRPPAVGYDFFKGPIVAGDTLGMSSFIYYINGTDPANATQTFNYMRGYTRDGGPVIDPTTSLQTRFYYPGDPVNGTGWLDSNPSDRRFMMITGPFHLAPGDQQTIVGAIVVSQGGDRLSSVTGLKFFDVKAQKAFDIDFQLPPPPPAPRMTFSTDHNQVNLFWDSGSRFNYTPAPGYAFEGYNVYQGASISGPWKRLKTFDVVNGVKDVREPVFDPNTGLIVNDTPTAFGGDNGVAYTYSTNSDAVRGGTLKDGTTYYYAVTAYAVNPAPPAGLEKVLETSFQPVIVTVQRPASGTDLASASASASTVHRVSTATPPTSDHVVVDIVDPASITGDTYAITYGPGVTPTWNLLNLTKGTTLLSGQTERTDNPSYAPIDGMIVKLRETQALSDPLNDVVYTPYRKDKPYGGVGAGLTTFEDSFGYAWDFFAGIDPSAQPELFTPVELRFGSGQKAYRFHRDETATGSAPANTGRGYTYGGFQNVPFTAWDTSVDPARQLEVAFVERRVTDDDGVQTGAQPATHDGVWGPDASDLGGREYLFISRRSYTGSEATELAQDQAVLGADTLWMYAAWLHKTGPAPTAGDQFKVLLGNQTGTANDTLVFTTQAARSGLSTLQDANKGMIRVVPNPYYARSTYELSSFNRIVKFMNMPEQATVRIFNLSGQLVRTLQKTDPKSSILEWDLENENRLPVASGVYIFHVDTPGASSTTGRVVVFMEKERLLTF